MFIKFMDKDLNLELLQEELIAAGLPSTVGLLIAGFHALRGAKLMYNSFTEREVIARATGQPDVWADPGELQFTYTSSLTARQEAALDQVLLDHDASQKARTQINREKDDADCVILADNYENWDNLNPTQKGESNRIMTRLTARLQNRGLDL